METMDEDEAKSIASDWIRRLEASLLAKVSDNNDNTISEDHIYRNYHQEGSVSSSFSHDDLERKHVDLEKTSSYEKIHHEATGLQSGKEIGLQKVDISEIKNPSESTSSSTSTTNLSKNAFASPRIDLKDLRKKRLERFENLIDPEAKDSEENSNDLASKSSYFAETASEDKMLQYKASSLAIEENILGNSQWKSKPCNYEAIRTISDEDDKLRLELWGLRGAVECGQLDIESYLGPLFCKPKKSCPHSENASKENPNSAHLKTLDNSSDIHYSREANFTPKKLHQYPDSESAKCLREKKDLWKTGNEFPNVSTLKSTLSHRSEANGIENTCESDRISKEDFTKFSVTKSKSKPSYSSRTSSWQQIEGKLYNGFETSDSESNASVPNKSHRSKSKSSHEKSDFTKPNEIRPLKSGKGKQRILNELTEFLDSEKNSKRDAKEGVRKNKKSSNESSRCVKSPVISGENLSVSQFLDQEFSYLNKTYSLPEAGNCTTFVHDYSMSSDSKYRELNLPHAADTYSKSRNLELISSVQGKDGNSSSVENGSASSGTQMAKVCNSCKEVNSKAANWCIECGTALIKVEPVLLTPEQQSKYEIQCQATKNLIAEALKSNKPLKNGSTTISKTEKDLVRDVLHLSKEVDKNTDFSNESLRSNLSNYKRRWLKSSTAWSSFEPQELSKPSSIVKMNEREKENNKKKGDKYLKSKSSNDISAAEGFHKKHGNHGNKTGHSRSAGRRRTTSANYHSADDHDSKKVLSFNLELSCNQERGPKDEPSNVRPGSAKSSGKSQRAKPQKKRPSSAKPRKHSQSSSRDLLSTSNGSEMGGNVVHIPQLKLDDIGSYDRILTLIRSQREPVPYLYLPEEIILQIFSYLSISDKVSCARVCWQLYRIAMDESLWKTIVIRKNRHINDDWLESIGDRHPSSLTITQCSGNNVTPNGLRTLFRKCSGTLEEVDMSGCGGELLGESILLHISARCLGVVSVDVSWTNVSDNGVEALAENLARLECLCLNGCQSITDKSLNCVANKHGESMRIFEVFGCFNITPGSLQVFANKCVHLQTLNIGQCHKMTDNAIGHLVSHLPELENLDLRGCKQARDLAVKKIVRHCPHLTSLVLANCPLITDVGLSEISANLPGIKSLDICGCSNITDAGVSALARCCHKLELLDLSSTGNCVTSKSVVSLGNYCSQSLQVLKLSFCADITPNTVSQLAKKCKKLRLLHLYGCKRIREQDKLKNVNPLLVIER